MSDYISRQANEKTYKLNNGQEVTFHYNDDGIGLATIEFMDAVFERLNNSVEVVRCKDCKHRNKEWYQDKRHKDGGYWLVCCENDAIAERIYGLAQDADYCSYGERDVRKNIKAKKVIGGGEHDGATCWFECSHCHGSVDIEDAYCKHCGAVLEYEK